MLLSDKYKMADYTIEEEKAIAEVKKIIISLSLSLSNIKVFYHLLINKYLVIYSEA